ncbi:conserved exported hypothetical protein [Tenacibaculum litopenaei]|uniref:YceI family protein n=1 Tax=Tenacibaculum litopenaei TaxID=396016 RepID=UPI0038934B32
MDISKINIRILCLLLFFTSQSMCAQKYFTRTGTTEFKASVDAFEPVEATSNSSSAILTNSGDFAAQVFINSFQFRVALMQEHFNENYMDSDSFPKATFRGKIQGFEGFDGSTMREYTLSGTLTIRGKTKKVTLPIRFTPNKGQWVLAGTFEVTAAEFGIEIPSIVRKKIAKNIRISIHYELSKK